MKVKFFATIREHTRSREIDVTEQGCGSVGDLLQYLCNLYGRGLCSLLLEDGKLGSQIIVLVNGRNVVHLRELDTPLERDDEVSIFPVVAGG
ncbi:MAG: ubiquitin-like small modifier protein 1 [Clostridia bacterium]|jgi:molybdopterin synthase sulfur carrier subunit|nr:MoaD/ThiS family protein [Clostridiales bacterium]